MFAERKVTGRWMTCPPISLFFLYALHTRRTRNRQIDTCRRRVGAGLTEPSSPSPCECCRDRQWPPSAVRQLAARPHGRDRLGSRPWDNQLCTSRSSEAIRSSSAPYYAELFEWTFQEN